MAFTRSLLTRLTEGLIRDFLANSDVQAYWKTRFYKGPFLGTDPSIVVPQGTVMPAPGAQVFEAGVTGVQGNFILSVLVGIFEPIRRGSLPIGSGALDEYDRLHLLKTIILNGSDLDGSGKIVDPDNSGSGNPVLRILNNDIATFKDIPPALIRDSASKATSIFWSFRADFITRIDNKTLLRA